MTAEIPNGVPDNVTPIAPHIEFYTSLGTGEIPDRARFVLKEVLPTLGLYCPQGEEGQIMVSKLLLWLSRHPNEPEGYAPNSLTQTNEGQLTQARRFRDIERFEERRARPQDGNQLT